MSFHSPVKTPKSGRNRFGPCYTGTPNLGEHVGPLCLRSGHVRLCNLMTETTLGPTCSTSTDLVSYRTLRPLPPLYVRLRVFSAFEMNGFPNSFNCLRGLVVHGWHFTHFVRNNTCIKKVSWQKLFTKTIHNNLFNYLLFSPTLLTHQFFWMSNLEVFK